MTKATHPIPVSSELSVDEMDHLCVSAELTLTSGVLCVCRPYRNLIIQHCFSWEPRCDDERKVDLCVTRADSRFWFPVAVFQLRNL